MPPRATRQPVMTSSKIETAPCSLQSDTIASRKPGSGGTTPMLPTTGSTMTAAISCPRAAKSFSSAAMSLYGSVSVVSPPSRDARRVGDAERERAGARLDEQEIGVPVVAALELHDDLAPREARARRGGRSWTPRCRSRRHAACRSTGRERRASRRSGPRAPSARRNSSRSPRPRATASTTAGCACPRIIGPHEPT